MGAIDMYAIEERAIKRYEKTMDQVYLLYHLHPTYITPHGFSPEEEAEYSEMTGVGNWCAAGCPMK